MKKYIALVLAILVMTACAVDSGQPPTDTVPQTTDYLLTTSAVIETTAETATTAAPETTVPPETTAAPETTIPPETTAAPETTVVPPSIAVPPEGTEGVYYAATFEALKALTSDSGFLGYVGRPTVCITEAFPFAEALVVERDVDLIYLPDCCVGGETLTLRSRSATVLKVSVVSGNLLRDGCLAIDAPFAALTVEGEDVPRAEEIAVYCNIASYNGQPLTPSYGGTGALLLTGAQLMDSVAGTPYEGTVLTVKGNLAILSVPLIVREGDVSSARVSFAASDGTLTPPRTLDLTRKNEITLTDAQGQTRVYRLIAKRLSYQLPIMSIRTDGGEPIVEKNTYLHGNITIGDTVYPMQIRGRGNASWTYFPKKSYRIKLDDGAPMFGLTQNRDWVLTSNYADKTLIRNCVAHTMAASMSGLDYTPTHIPVHLYLNGSYLGVYTFADKIEDGKGRLDLGGTTDAQGKLDVGFLVEIGWDFDQENVYNLDYFDAEMVLRIFVKEPEIKQANSKEFLYVKNYILAAEKAIMAGEGWEKYIDVDSWIDWLIINEMTFNTESAFYRSCYLWRESGGRLKLGPVWDFDMAFGNHYGDIKGYDGWCTTESTYQFIRKNWMNCLMEDSRFTGRLVERWNEVKDNLRTTALDSIDRYAAMMEGSQQQNFLVWPIMRVGVGMGSVNPYIYNTYDKQVQYLRDFIVSRWDYIDTRLNSPEYCSG